MKNNSDNFNVSGFEKEMQEIRRKSEGENVNSADIKKHKNDVFRLMNIINPDEVVNTPETVKENVRRTYQYEKYWA